MVQVWKTVRVFVSSTFRDMQAERDYLVKVVFPELRERCARRRLHLVDVDLRWGVTEEEAEQGKVVEVVLDEIDRSRPFFIAMLGESYGSLPDKVPEDAEFVYPWLRDHRDCSLTALEILHGVLRSPDLAGRSFFYLRDPQVIFQIPEGKRTQFVAENNDASRKLADLKEKIRASGRPVLENYRCRWDESEGHLVDLDAFGLRVLEDLWTGICAEYPEEVSEVDPIIVEREMHEVFAEERSHLHVGRLKQREWLNEYVKGKDRRPAVIAGESGCGKSAFLANWYRQYTSKHPDDFVLAYFIGASPDSTNHFRLLRNMCEELKHEFALKEEISQDDEKLAETLAMLLVTASRDKSRIVIVLDALDQLLPLEAAYGLGWLLDYIPEKTRLVVSSLEGDCLDALRQRDVEEIVLPPLSVDEQRQIIQALLGEWRRKLDAQQMAALLAHSEASNPLYLRVALEELRLFGRFEGLTTRIKMLADDVSGLFDQVLTRLEQDHGRELVAETFALLDCSRYGLTEAELLSMLHPEGEEQFPRILWARLTRSAKAYLVRRGELLSFFHRQLSDAVRMRYSARANKDNKHGKLARYFEQAPFERRLDEYPYQLQRAEQWQALAAALSDLDLFNYAWDQDRKYEWMSYWRSLEKRFDPVHCYKVAWEKREKAGDKGQDDDISPWRIGRLLYDMALYPSALIFMQRDLANRERALGPDHPDVAASLHNLACLLRAQGKYAEALPLLKRSLAISERVLGPNHSVVASSLKGLAGLYDDQGKYAEALPLYQRALAIKERALGPNHPDVSVCLNDLAVSYDEQGKYAEALSLLKRSLAISERALGPNHPEVATILCNLAGLYDDQGKYAEALPLYQRALAIRERALGPNHPVVAGSLGCLAELYEKQGKYEEALLHAQRSLAIREHALGANHRDVALSLSPLAGLYEKQGKYAEALPLYQRALAIHERALGPNHPEVATILCNLAGLYDDQGKYAEALPLYQRALAIRERALGPNHIDVANTLYNLAAHYGEQSKNTEELPLIERAVRITEATLGSDNLFTKRCKHARAIILMRRDLWRWGFWFVLAGIIILLLFALENTIWMNVLTISSILSLLYQRYSFANLYWGGIIIALGVLTLRLRDAGMLFFMGAVLFLAGILNITAGEYGLWTVFGIFQILAGIYVARKMWKYSE